MTVTAQGIDGGDDSAARKIAPGVSCLKMKTTVKCMIAKEMTPAQAKGLYQLLASPEIETNQINVQVKMVSKLIVVSDDEEDEYSVAKAIFRHACEIVRGAKDAQACVSFWVRDVMNNYNLDNDAVVLKGLSRRPLLVEVINENFGENYAREAVERARRAERLVVMGEYGDEIHVVYLGINTGFNVVPEIIADLNTVDIDARQNKAFVERMNAAGSEAAKMKLVRAEANRYLLGAMNRFPVVRDLLIERLGYGFF